MKFIAVLVLSLLIPVAAFAGEPGGQKATDAAKSWLALVDAGDYAQSWRAASTLFNSHVMEAQWNTAVSAARAPLGSVVARNVAGVNLATTLPGAPDGQYAVVKFATRFANKAAATETIAMAKDGGSWKTAGYHVR
ncbi:MAG: DUF4019 domain-containing protein [Rhizomicrobium sp.]